MSASSLLLGLCESTPRISRLGLKWYLRRRFPISPWVAHRLIKTLDTQEKRTVAVGDGLRMTVDMSTAVGRQIYYYGTYEPSVTDYLRDHIRAGDTLIDAGANVGELTIRGSRLVGPEGKVIAVEASPKTARILKDNVELNTCNNVDIVEAALTSEDKDCAFFLGKGDSSLTSSLTPPDDHSGEQVRVRGLCLPSLLSELGNRSPSVIKMDIEGAEYDALKPCIEMLGSLLPRPHIIFEFNLAVAKRADWTASGMNEMLNGAGFRMFYLNGERAGKEFSASDESEYAADMKVDFVAK